MPAPSGSASDRRVLAWLGTHERQCAGRIFLPSTQDPGRERQQGRDRARRDPRSREAQHQPRFRHRRPSAERLESRHQRRIDHLPSAAFVSGAASRITATTTRLRHAQGVLHADGRSDEEHDVSAGERRESREPDQSQQQVALLQQLQLRHLPDPPARGSMGLSTIRPNRAAKLAAAYVKLVQKYVFEPVGAVGVDAKPPASRPAGDRVRVLVRIPGNVGRPRLGRRHGRRRRRGLVPGDRRHRQGPATA